MALFQNVGQRGWLTLVLGIVGGLAAGLMAGGKLMSGGEGRDEIVEDEAVPDDDAPDEIIRESRSGRISLVRRASYLAFKGFEFQLYTGGYHCSLDFFDTRYFTYLDDGTTEQGVQWFKFRAKDKEETDNAEIRFKLTGSRYNKLIYQVIIVDSMDHSIHGGNNLAE